MAREPFSGVKSSPTRNGRCEKTVPGSVRTIPSTRMSEIVNAAASPARAKAARTPEAILVNLKSCKTVLSLNRVRGALRDVARFASPLEKGGRGHAEKFVSWRPPPSAENANQGREQGYQKAHRPCDPEGAKYGVFHTPSSHVRGSGRSTFSVDPRGSAYGPVKRETSLKVT